MKKLFPCVLAVLIVFGYGLSPSAEGEDISAMIKTAAEYVYKSADNPTVSSVGGEWAVLGLARSGKSDLEDYFSKYQNNLSKVLKESGGVLHDRKYTEYARVILAFTATGGDAQNAYGYNLTLPLEDYEKTVWQGINGAIWALIALDCRGYGNSEIRQKYLDYILSLELDKGGWSLSPQIGEADVDVTAMALTALASYRGLKQVDDAVERGVLLLSSMQNENGGYMSFETENAESAAQVLTAISSLGISYRDERFTKKANTIVDYLRGFIKSGGFMHTLNDTEPNLMTTEQCLYSLVAAQRQLLGDNALFDMSDSKKSDVMSASLAKLDRISKAVVKYPHKTFEDIKDNKYRASVEALAQRGIISGMTQSSFVPDSTMTRAQFAAITVMALGLPLSYDAVFDDVGESDWFFPYVSAAYREKIVNGVSETEFMPNGTISREQAAVMLTRAAALCGLDTDMSQYSLRDILAQYPDYISISPWAKDAVAYCCVGKILDSDVIELKPQEAVTRGEIAQMVYNLLGKAELI